MLSTEVVQAVESWLEAHRGMPTCLDNFCGEGGAGAGYAGAGFHVFGVDQVAARLRRYPFPSVQADALEVLHRFGSRFSLRHNSPTCTGFSRGTAAVPDRLTRYPRLIGAVRELCREAGGPYVIENVADARSELQTPVLLCGRQFGLTATDDDGTHLVLDRHRLFESNAALLVPEHPTHDRTLQVAGSYAGARRDKAEARHVRRGGYVPSVEVQRTLLGTPWMSERGCQLSIPPAYTRHLGEQLL